jgi:hypothetical protein
VTGFKPGAGVKELRPQQFNCRLAEASNLAGGWTDGKKGKKLFFYY